MLLSYKGECARKKKKYLINLILEKEKGVYLEEKENENINHLIISIKQSPRGSPSKSKVK